MPGFASNKSPPSGNPYGNVKRTAPQHITWKKIRTYTTAYTRTGKLPKNYLPPTHDGLSNPKQRRVITVRSVSRPKKERLFRTATGLKKYKAAYTTTTLREVIIVARTKSRKKPVDKDEIEEVEALEELEELEEEDFEDEDTDEEEPDDEEEEDEDDEDEEEDDEPPKSKRSTKSKASSKAKTPAKSKAPAKTRAQANGKVGTHELAEHFGVDGRTLRIVLRKHKIQKDPDSGRYEWDSFKNKEVVKIGKLLEKGEATKARRESLDKLKAKKAAETSGKKKKKAPVEPEPDEVDDDDIEDEEEEEPTPAPKKKTKRSKK